MAPFHSTKAAWSKFLRKVFGLDSKLFTKGQIDSKRGFGSAVPEKG
jgi:fumarylacetoacetate (FAA) hydrolase family protein